MFNNYQCFEDNHREKLMVKNCYILYIDILGYKNLLNEDDKLLIKIKYLMSVIIKDRIETYNDNPFRYQIFSDNIVIGIDQKKKSSLKRLISFSSRLQSMALFHFGFLMRGAITSGELYIDNDFVFGKGLVYAYSLESHCSIMPRVIIDKSLYNEEYVKNSKHKICTYIDEQKFVNYLHYYFENSLTDDPNRGTQLKAMYDYMMDRLEKYRLQSTKKYTNIRYVKYRLYTLFIKRRLKNHHKKSLEKAKVSEKIIWTHEFHKHILQEQGVAEHYQ